MRPQAMAFLLLLAGCTGAGPDSDAEPPADGARAAEPGPEALVFGEPMVIDDLRAGGEPVIAVTRGGVVLVSSHPGWTHVHPPDDPSDPATELLVPASGQSYLWRSADGGATWEHVGLPMAMGTGPRGAAPGVSDPDLTVTEANRAYHTDLEALAQASVSWSDDDGETWVEGNPIASGGAIDRQWLASAGDYVYFTGNYFGDRRLLRSTDGIQWERIGELPDGCGGDFVAVPGDVLYAGCGAGIGASEDGGATWEERPVPGHEAGGNFQMAEPAVDSGGNVWMAWQENETELYLAGSPDHGVTWPWIHEVSGSVSAALGGAPDRTIIWPWVSAGSAGRVALTVYATPTPPPSDEGPQDRLWSVVTVAVFGADSDMPRVSGHLVKDGFHQGAVCQGGTGCQVGSVQGDDNSDRRLGDFFETTIDAEGFLHIVYSDTTTAPQDVVSHTGYVRQTDGPRFVVEGYMPTQG